MTALKLDPKHPLLQAEVINSFTSSVVNTITKMSGLAVESKAASIEYKLDIESEVAGLVGVTSAHGRGLFIVSFSREAILNIHNHMLSETLKEVTDSVADTVGELSNVIYSSSKTTLNQKGFNLNMAIPTITRGRFKVTNNSKSLTVLLPFRVAGAADFLVALTVDE